MWGQFWPIAEEEVVEFKHDFRQQGAVGRTQDFSGAARLEGTTQNFTSFNPERKRMERYAVEVKVEGEKGRKKNTNHTFKHLKLLSSPHHQQHKTISRSFSHTARVGGNRREG